MLDTNIVSDLIHHPQGTVAEHIEDADQDALCVSIITAAELRYGCEKRGSDKLTQRVEAILACLEILPFEAPMDKAYGHIRADLEKLGTPIGPNDLLIAAHALSLNALLITDNEKEFRRVDGLRVENWLADH